MLKATTTAELLLYAGLTALVIGTVWRVVVRDQGMSRFIRCGLVTIVYLIATSPLAVRSIFVQGREETTYIYPPGWILLSSTSFMANILVTNCIAIWRCWFLSGRRWMFSVIPGLCTLVGTVFSGFSLYKMIATSASGNTCATQIDWMLPYFSMSVAVTILCTVVILYRTVMGPSIGRRTRQLWINVIIESSLFFVVGPIIFLVVYITSDIRTGCPLPVVTMIMGLAPVRAVARVPSDATMQESAPLELRIRLETEGNV
ncbi:hypothetical protein ARMSODRAFT_1018269 [Armillaria solidipes]|uniref:Uncharacterized protein n=1 Tax=Armillaria solidipes TaxID=1076256 RepID=A0A2H3BVU9_9AGAR|nr:hypothetical protein ARMSODRAFT_1018269 [Armillaria solidipes]